MQTYSPILRHYYDADNAVYITNVVQARLYLKHAHEDFVDILYSGTKREDTLVFVFLKTPRIKELYKKWQAHELT